ncbi:tyrosine-type recombinase/integrase [uncultured Agrobacterium sp.]|uniref:tyrosine-type recombinase/integrase n=1 Tax=uncultured Agrobacterium sp. TaxID=157277 RepID=UPI0025D8DCB9|nr:tyrosine-type recombinase/integrase [uncultured Agrobacterium sp.]
MSVSMPRKLPLHVVKEVTRHGKIVFYFRIGKGDRIRLPGIPGSKEFKKAYQAALLGQRIAHVETTTIARSLQWLVQQYMESAEWSGLSVATRKQRGLFYRQVIDASGKVDCRAVTKADVQNAMERRKSTPALANNFKKSLSALFKWGLDHSHVSVDPTAGVKRLKTLNTDGFPIWTLEDINNFTKRWPLGTRERLAFELIVASGLRRSDAVRAGRQHLTDDVLKIKTQKTNTQVTVEFSPRVLDLIEQTQTGDFAFIVGKKGLPLTKESFGNWFRDTCRAAGVEKSAHGLRKFSATLAAEAGATSHQLMAQFGWVNVKQAEVYTKGADRALLGKASSRLVEEQIRTKLSPHLVSGEGNMTKNPLKSNG